MDGMPRSPSTAAAAREDEETARQAGLDPASPSDALRLLYRNLASGAESGWDFSTRWLAGGSTELKDIRTTLVISADLNAFLFQMETNIADFARELGCTEVERQFRALAGQRRVPLISPGRLCMGWGAAWAVPFFDPSPPAPPPPAGATP